jgi:plastocyanin
MRKSLLTLCLLSLLAIAACGKEKDPFAFDPGAGGAAGGGANAVTLNATVKGKIVFDGAAPMPKPISTSSDPGCKNNSLVAEDTVVSDGGLENVIIYVSGGDIQGKTFPASTEVKTLNQEGCHYIPHALSIQVGQPLKIVNSDDTAHNIHAWAMVNTPFNESQSSKGVETTKHFDKEEVLLPVKCDVHNWMNAFIGVFKHPFHTVSGKGGAYELKLTAGTYEITAEHEKLGTQKAMITVAADGSVEQNFTFKAK